MGQCQAAVGTTRLDAAILSAESFSAKYKRRVSGDLKSSSELVLGKGSFGKVVLVEDKRTRETRALKMIKKKPRGGGATKLLESLETEIRVLRTCGAHPHVLSLHDVFDSRTKVLLVLELATGGDLLQRVTARPEDLSERLAASATKQISLALQFLHSQSVVHRDVKPENCLLRDDHSFVIKVADFGCSKFLRKKHKLDPVCSDDLLMTSYVGTRAYAAPEILRREPYDASCDIYSLGVLLALLLTGRHPLSDVQLDTNLGLASLDLPYLVQFDRPEWRGVSNQARSLVEALAHTDPKHRPTPAAVLEIPWVDHGDSTADPAPLAPRVVEGLRATRCDDLQALALRLLVEPSTHPSSLAHAIDEADALFDKLDADRTGLIRRDELKRAAGGGVDDNALDAAFDAADLDGSGVVERAELRASLLAAQSSLLDSLAELAFWKMDVSKSGAVTPDDVYRVATQLHPNARIALADVKAWIHAHDGKGNGQLDKSEFATMLASIRQTTSVRGLTTV